MTPTPESQQAALKLFVCAANIRMNNHNGFTQKLCAGHRLASSEHEARGIYTKHLQDTFSAWMICDLLVAEVLPEHLPSHAPVDVSHAALIEELETYAKDWRVRAADAGPVQKAIQALRGEV